MPASVAPSAQSVAHSRYPRARRSRHVHEGRVQAVLWRIEPAYPDYIKRAAQSDADGFTYYTENAGLPSSAADSRALLRGDPGRPGLDPATEIVVTASGVQALNLAIRWCSTPATRPSSSHRRSQRSANVQMANAVVKQIPQPSVRKAL